MSTSTVDTLARLAASAEPPPLEAAATERLIERALDARPVMRREPARARMRWPTAALAAAVAAAIAIAWWRPAPAVAEPELLHVALPTGDQLVGTSRARFDVERVERTDRRVRLRTGTLLADVAHVAPGQRFAIATAHLVATARGTIFSVETDAVRTRVRVFEGTVEIAQEGDTHLLAAGTMWTSDAHQLAVAPARPPALATEIAAAIDRRAADPVERAASPPRTAQADDPSALARAHGAADPSAARSQSAADARAWGAADPSAARSQPAADPSAARSQAEADARAWGAADASAHAPSAARSQAAADASTRVVADPSAARSQDAGASPAAERTASLDELLARARGALAAGKLDDALAIAKQAAARGATTGPWRIVTADALRGLGRTADAVDAFEAGARELAGADAFEAGYSAAYLALHELRDAGRALVALGAARVDAEDSPLEERGLVLHVRILEALHREADAAPIAARYVARYPHGELRAAMQALAKPAR